MVNHGTWVHYEPEQRPLGVPANALFWQRKSDKADWYEWSRSRWSIEAGEDGSNITKVVVFEGRVICVDRDATRLSIPPSFTLYELTPSEAVPSPGWYLYGSVFTSERQYSSPAEERAALPNISARQLWLMALEIEVTKASVLASLDTMEDRGEAERLRIELTEPPLDGYERLSPAVEKFRVMQGLSEERFDELWKRASQIK